jgi:hypothetical protein
VLTFSRSSTSRAMSMVGILVAALSATYCIDAPLLAPDGSNIELAANPNQIAVDGDTATLTAFVTESDGRMVDNGTEVSFLTTSGSVCPAQRPDAGAACGSDVPVSALTVKTAGGVASALLRSSVAPGTVTVTARSGGVTKTATVTFNARVAAANAKFVLQSDHDTISVGQRATITAFLASPDGPVPNGTRVVFAAPDGTVIRQIVETQDGFAQTSIVGKQVGQLVVRATSGVVRDSILVPIK